MSIEKLNIYTAKQACINRLEELILSGELKIGARLPAERDLAARLGISRPVLHEALVDLAAKGLVQIAPRRGVFINDFRTYGSIAILESLLSYHNGSLDPAMLQSMLAMRMLLETETARLAALNHKPEHLKILQDILIQEQQTEPGDTEQRTQLDFSFHLQVAVASENLVYPMIINSFKAVYTNLTGKFFAAYANSAVIVQVFEYHSLLVKAIQQRDPHSASTIMGEMLQHGEQNLRAVYYKEHEHVYHHA
ncbi:MAG: FadR family transcriptional regulator [Anaerolineae bacterium]|nr:FadR family transcriptional regulator [Anaerolineae bacterium]